MNNPDKLQAAPVQKIESVFIMGAGTMGREIAFQCARYGRRVLLHDSSPLALQQAIAGMQIFAQRFEAEGQLPHDQVQPILQRIVARSDLVAAAEADLIIECVPENVTLKQRLFKEVSEHCHAKTILATNTSSLIPSQLAAYCRHPEMLAALHFHLPVATSNIVDLMPHPGTDPEVIGSLNAFARSIGQIPIRYACEYHGYIFNSIFGAMQRQALDLVSQEVATFEDVDRSWMGIFKMPIGPFGMFDNIGLDTIAEILHHWAETLNDDAGRRRVAFLRRWTNENFLGTKTNRGFYEYPDPAYAQPNFLAGSKV